MKTITTQFKYSVAFSISFLLLFCTVFFPNCKPDPEQKPPTISLIFDNGFTSNGDTLEIGKPLRFKVKVEGIDANITNFTIKKLYSGTTKTVLDSGLNSSGFTTSLTFYQGVEDRVEWQFSVMDRDRYEAKTSIVLYKDPNSQFGGIYEYENIRLGYQTNSTYGHFFLPSMNQVFFEDTASMNQSAVDVLVYFNYSEDNGILLPSPTFSSPGEDANCVGLLYDEYYPFICAWSTKNYTKWDIRADNGVTEQLYSNAHNDSLLIVSYDDVWGKKKYKWAVAGTIIPFQTAAGKKGIVKVNDADTIDGGSINFSMKIQM